MKSRLRSCLAGLILACCCSAAAQTPPTAGELGAYRGLFLAVVNGDQAALERGYTEMARIQRAASGD